MRARRSFAALFSLSLAACAPSVAPSDASLVDASPDVPRPPRDGGVDSAARDSEPLEDSGVRVPCEDFDPAAVPDPAAIGQAINCMGRIRPAAEHERYIRSLITAVESHGGFPATVPEGLLFVYVANETYDAEDDRTHAEEDFSPARRRGTINLVGDFNGWRLRDAIRFESFNDVYMAVLPSRPAPGDRWGYKFVAVDGDTEVYFSDPLSRRFLYDDNGRISLVSRTTNRSHLEWLSPRVTGGRPLYIYVPPMAAMETAALPLLLVHDGNNAFDTAQPRSAPASWDLDAVADAEIAAARVRPFYIAAVPNTNERFDEYTHTRDTVSGMTVGGAGDAYVTYLVDRVLPLVRARYNVAATRESTAVFGSSLGGLISYHAGLTRPEVFGLVGGMSSTFGWGSFAGGADTMVARYRAASMLSTRSQRFYLDSGGAQGATACPANGEGDGSDNFCETAQMRAALVAQGISTFPDDPSAEHLTPAGANILHWHQAGAAHSESAWGPRAFRALRFFFGR